MTPGHEAGAEGDGQGGKALLTFGNRVLPQSRIDDNVGREGGKKWRHLPFWPSDKPIFLPDNMVPDQMKKKAKAAQ